MPERILWPHLLLGALLCLLLLPPILPAKEGPAPGCTSQGWPHEKSDLPVDPDIRFGTLDNGLRYLIRKNREPRKRVALYLNVQAGSLQESDEERGLAHYLEHMLFNGSTHYPPGTLIKYFQSIGMDFGADTNAHTAYDETVYTLTLPAADEKTLAEGLTVLADFARGALLLESEVDRERGVIFSEKRSRDTAAARVRKARLAFDFAGTIVAERDPIGIEATLQQADSARLRAFYDKWYRPDNMIVVMVGDMDPRLAEGLLRQHFAPLTPAAKARPVCPQYGEPAATGLRLHYLAEPELGHTEVSLSTVRALPAGPDTLARETERLHQDLAMILLNNRLQQLEREAGSPISGSMVYSGPFLPQFRYTLLGARTEAARWHKGLQLLTGVLEQALREGFTEAELTRGKKEILAMLEEEAQSAGGRDSRELAMELVQALNNGEVPLAPAGKKALFAPLTRQSTLAEVNRALHELWPREPRTVSVAGTAMPAQSAAQARTRMQAVYTGALSAQARPWHKMAARAFPYLAYRQEPIRPTGQQSDSATQVQTLTFGGGVVAHLKKTDFQPNQVLLNLHFGQGLAGETPPGAAMLAPGLINESGTGAMSREQLQEVLAGTSLSLDFAVAAESFSFRGSCLSSELERMLQVLHARLHDPGFRPEAFARVREQLEQMYAGLASSVEGVQRLAGDHFLSGGSRAFATPAWQEVARITLPQLEAWLRPAFAHAPLEINIVGDIDLKETKRLLGRYFGEERRTAATALPARKTPAFPAGQSRRFTAAAASDKAYLTLAWKTDDFWNIQRTRGLNLLASILEDRLRVKIREELGSTYSPQVFSLPGKIDPGFGLLESRMIVAPAQAEKLAQVVRDETARLARNGVSAEAFKRAQAPTLTAIREQMRSNSYWLHVVLSLSSRHPEQLEWPKHIVQEFEAMQAADVNRLAAQYLGPEQAATVLVVPASSR